MMSLTLFRGLSLDNEQLLSNTYFSKNNKHYLVNTDNTIVEIIPQTLVLNFFSIIGINRNSEHLFDIGNSFDYIVNNVQTIKFKAKSKKDNEFVYGTGLSINYWLNTFSIVNPYADGIALDSYDTIDLININIQTLSLSFPNIIDSFGEPIWFDLKL